MPMVAFLVIAQSPHVLRPSWTPPDDSRGRHEHHRTGFGSRGRWGEAPRILVRRHEDDHTRSRAGACKARRRKNFPWSNIVMAALLRFLRRAVKNKPSRREPALCLTPTRAGSSPGRQCTAFETHGVETAWQRPYNV